MKKIVFGFCVFALSSLAFADQKGTTLLPVPAAHDQSNVLAQIEITVQPWAQENFQGIYTVRLVEGGELIFEFLPRIDGVKPRLSHVVRVSDKIVQDISGLGETIVKDNIEIVGPDLRPCATALSSAYQIRNKNGNLVTFFRHEGCYDFIPTDRVLNENLRSLKSLLIDFQRLAITHEYGLVPDWPFDPRQEIAQRHP